ncbi:unnamed protein product [Leptosia nina]|uniref:Uncharacterized protein n=1 Tax=Leptosia nina TaxID=320188 RepID=A0AAV1JZB7_9NEOP
MFRSIRQSASLILLAVLFVIGMYLYFYSYIQTESDVSRHKRCISELDSLKYQLNVVTEYKNRLDSLLSEMQKKYDAERERFKEIMDSCLAMKQQTAICQSQFEDLQVECKNVKEESVKLKKEMVKLKPAR